MSAIVPFQCDKRHVPNNGSLQLSSDLGVSYSSHSLCFMRPVSLLVYLHCGLWAIFMVSLLFFRCYTIAFDNYLDKHSSVTNSFDINMLKFGGEVIWISLMTSTSPANFPSGLCRLVSQITWSLIQFRCKTFLISFRERSSSRDIHGTARSLQVNGLYLEIPASHPDRISHHLFWIRNTGPTRRYFELYL